MVPLCVFYMLLMFDTTVVNHFVFIYELIAVREDIDWSMKCVYIQIRFWCASQSITVTRRLCNQHYQKFYKQYLIAKSSCRNTANIKWLFTIKEQFFFLVLCALRRVHQ